MKIAVDAYGGDNSPLSVLKGAEMAQREYGIEIILSGKEQELRRTAKEAGISLENISFLEAPTVIPVEADPSSIVDKYADSSMALAIKAVADGTADAVVSAGSTGAILVGAIRWAKRIKGIRRPSLGVVIPNSKGFHLLIDSGANSLCRPDMLLQFGIMGSLYMKNLMGVENPRVGMVNIGTEANKGLELQIEASKLLAEAPINFIGNVEASTLPLGSCDVAVADGFTGNILLKHTEGMAKMMIGELKGMLMSGTKSKLAALMLKKDLKKMMKKMDASEYGGVPLLGIAKPVIKAHGSADAKAIKNAIGQGKRVVEQRVIANIEEALNLMKKADQERT